MDSQVAPEWMIDMTLRDWFAGQAMLKLIGGMVGYGRCCDDPYLACRAYEIADAMMLERAEKDSADAVRRKQDV